MSVHLSMVNHGNVAWGVESKRHDLSVHKLFCCEYLKDIDECYSAHLDDKGIKDSWKKYMEKLMNEEK